MSEIRPPFVSFENRQVEDRAASLKHGFKVLVDVPYICLVPHGSEGRTRIEQPYEEWLAKIRGKVDLELRAPGAGSDTPLMMQSRFPRAWLEQIELAFAAWRKGITLDVEGTPLRNWPVITKAQLENCEHLHLYTIEALAEATDETTERLGMGGVALRQRARDWLAAKAGDAGKLSAELEALRVRLQDLEAENAELKEKIAAFVAAGAEA